MDDSLNNISGKRPEGIKKLTKHLIAIGAFILIAAVYCSPVFDGKKINAHDTNQHKGMSKEIFDHREEFDEEPLWTNSMFGGMPTFQISILYPKNLIKKIDLALNLGLPQPIGVIFKYMLGFYILLLALKVPWKYAIAGSIAFAFSSYFMIILEAGHNTKAKAVSYMAPMIAGIILSYRGKYLIGAAVTALFLSLNIVSNHVQVTYYAGLSVLVLGAFELWKGLKNRNMKSFAIGTGVSVVALILALLVNNTNLRLTSDYVKDTQRGTSRLEIKARKAKEKEDALQMQLEASKGDVGVKPMSAKKAYATRWSYGIQESFTLLIPDFKGGGSSDAHRDTETYKTIKKYLKRQNPRISKKELSKQAGKQTGSILYWGDQPGVNGPVYIGAGIVLLFILGLILVKSEHKWWLLITALLGLFISYGKNSLGFFHFMFDYFPLYDKFRAVTIGMVITELAFPLLGFLFLKELLLGELDKERVYKVCLYGTGALAGVLVLFYLGSANLFDFSKASDVQMGEDFARIIKKDRIEIFKSDVGRSLLIVLLTGGVVLAICKQWFKHNVIAIGLALICVGDLYAVSSRYLNESVYKKEAKVSKPFKEKKANTEILKDKSNFRVFNVSAGVGGAINDASTSYFHHTIGGYSSVKLMNYQDLLDYSLGADMQKIASGLGRIQDEFGGLPLHEFNKLCSSTNLLNMMNTKYIIIHKDYPPLVNSNAFGNAWLVKGIQSYDSPDSVMFNLPNRDLKQFALAEKVDVSGLEGRSYSTEGNVVLANYKANHLTYDFKAKGDSYVVFSEVYYKGWNAYIDGELVLHNKVNYVLRGLEVPKGNHIIEFKFEPTIYAQGENISLIGSLIVILLLVLAAFKGYKTLESVSE